jgi:hypothetical protein
VSLGFCLIHCVPLSPDKRTSPATQTAKNSQNMHTRDSDKALTELFEKAAREGREAANQQYVIEQMIKKAVRSVLKSQKPRRTTGPTSRKK